ncbi:MAG: hypothetical protein Q9161_000285 [Pseudevernia consocians]
MAPNASINKATNLWWTISSDLPWPSTLLALAQRLLFLSYILSSSSSSSSPTPASSLPLPPIPDTFHAAVSGMLCERAKRKRRNSATIAIGKAPADALTEVLRRLLKGKVRRMEGSLATVIRVTQPQRLRLRNQRLAYKISTAGMYLSAKLMVAPSGALPV